MSPQNKALFNDFGQVASFVPQHNRSVSVPVSHHSNSTHHSECHNEGNTRVCHSDSSGSSSSSSFNVGV